MAADVYALYPLMIRPHAAQFSNRGIKQEKVSKIHE
jgi:hypothetical protein